MLSNPSPGLFMLCVSMLIFLLVVIFTVCKYGENHWKPKSHSLYAQTYVTNKSHFMVIYSVVLETFFHTEPKTQWWHQRRNQSLKNVSSREHECLYKMAIHLIVVEIFHFETKAVNQLVCKNTPTIINYLVHHQITGISLIQLFNSGFFLTA